MKEEDKKMASAELGQIFKPQRSIFKQKPVPWAGDSQIYYKSPLPFMMDLLEMVIATYGTKLMVAKVVLRLGRAFLNIY